MGYLLAAVVFAIDDLAISRVADTFLSRDLGGVKNHLTEHRHVFRGQIVHRGDVLLGNNQEVDRRLRMDIVKNDNIVIFEDFGGGNFAGDDFTEDTFGISHMSSLSTARAQI